MANSFSFLYPYIDKAVQDVDFENLAPLTVFDKDLDPAGGLTGRIPRTFATTASAFTPTMYIDSGNSGTVSGINYTVDQAYVASYQYKYNEGLGLGSRAAEVIGGWVQEGVRAVLKAMNSGFYASGVVGGGIYNPGVSNIVGTAGTTPFASPWADIINVNTALERNMCPQDGRVGIFDLAAWANILNATGLTNFYASNSDQTLRSAKVGRLFDFDVVRDQLVPTFAGSTTGDTGTHVISGAVSSGALTGYMFQSGGVTGAKKVGDIFVLTGLDGEATSGYGQQYVVTTAWTPGETGAGQATGISWYPKLRGSGTTLVQAVFLTGTRRQNVLGHKSAIKLIMRDPRAGMQGMPQLGQDMLYIDPKTKVPLLITFVPGNLMVTIQVKALWTWVVVKPEWACIMAG